MSRENARKPSATDWKRLEAMSDDQIDFTDIPELGEEFFKRASLRLPEDAKPVTVRLDPDVLDWLESQGQGLDGPINAILHRYMAATRKG